MKRFVLPLSALAVMIAIAALALPKGNAPALTTKWAKQAKAETTVAGGTGLCGCDAASILKRNRQSTMRCMRVPVVFI